MLEAESDQRFMVTLPKIFHRNEIFLGGFKNFEDLGLPNLLDKARWCGPIHIKGPSIRWPGQAPHLPPPPLPGNLKVEPHYGNFITRVYKVGMVKSISQFNEKVLNLEKL